MKQMSRVAAAVCLLLARADANTPADPNAAPSAVPPASMAAAGPTKSPAVARLLAIGTTFVGYGLVAGAIFTDSNAAGLSLFFGGQAVAAVGPSMGHFYAGETEHALTFSGIRAGALLAANVGAFLVAGCVSREAIAGGSDDPSGCNDTAGTVLVLGGLAVAAGFGLYDWIDSGRAARRHNLRPGRTQAFVPLVAPRTGTFGLAFTASF